MVLPHWEKQENNRKGSRGEYREKVILLTKNHGRDYDAFKKQRAESLRGFMTDVIDALQFHEIILDGEPEGISEQGAIDDAVEAGRTNRNPELITIEIHASESKGYRGEY